MSSPAKYKVKPLPVERRAYKVSEYCQAYGVSRAMAYKLMACGKLKFFEVGSDRRIPVEAAEALENQA